DRNSTRRDSCVFSRASSHPEVRRKRKKSGRRMVPIRRPLAKGSVLLVEDFRVVRFCPGQGFRRGGPFDRVVYQQLVSRIFPGQVVMSRLDIEDRAVLGGFVPSVEVAVLALRVQ